MSWANLVALVRRTLGAVCIALALGIAAWGVGILSAEALRLPLRTPTLWLSRMVLGLFTDDVFVDVPKFIFGTSTFTVEIAPQCSGLEGVGLIFAFTVAYLWMARDSLRFPQALLIPLIGMLCAWIFNSVRLAILVAVGSWISPDIAVGGFHTLAGLIAFCGISLGLVYSTRHAEFFSKESRSDPSDRLRDPTLALLGPFLASVAVGLVIHGLGQGAQQLYPLQPAVAVLVLFLLRRSYGRPQVRASWHGIAVGLLAFAVWILFFRASTDGTANEALQNSLNLMGPWARWSWILSRVIGFGLVTPVIEELAFRSYLIRRLTEREWQRLPLEDFSWTALLASSLLFGALHETWLLATVVGSMYGLVLRRRGNLADAVVAHATTNVMLLLQALIERDWSVLG